MKWGSAFFALLTLALIGCGGGGGGGGGGSNAATVTGRVIQVETGAAPNPTASVQMGNSSVFTDPSDGSFQLQTSNGNTQVTVDTRSASGVWTFQVPPVSGVTDVGDLWVGPEKVTLQGVVRNSSDNSVIPNATVRFGGRSGVTNGTGTFTIADVAYSSATQVSFWGIPGTVQASGFFASTFSAAPQTAVGGIVDVGTILLVPTSSPNPPGLPYNIWGQITASGGPSGSIVRLKQSGNDVRVFNVGPDGRYFFFVPAGSYTISASKGASTAPDVNVTLSSPTEVIQRDIAIP